MAWWGWPLTGIVVGWVLVLTGIVWAVRHVPTTEPSEQAEEERIG